MTTTFQFSSDAERLFLSFRSVMTSALGDSTITSTFEEFSAFIQKGSTLKAALQLLKETRTEELCAKPSPRVLLAAFMVSLFPVDILEISEEEMESRPEERALDRSCFLSSKAVVVAFTEENGTLEAALRALSTFQGLFNEWKEFDRQRVLQTLANAHHQWVASLEHLEASRADTRDPESLQIMVESCERQMAANKRRILQLGGPEALEQVMNSPPIQINLEQIMTELSSKKYWEEFGEELRQTPPKYDRIAVLLTEIRDRLKNLIPNRSDVQGEIDASLDIDFIRQMIEFGSFDAPSFFRVFDVIWNHIKNFGAASAEAEWDQWRANILESTRNGQATYDVLLPEIFNRFLRQLDLIEDATHRYREMMSQNRNAVAAGSAA